MTKIKRKITKINDSAADAAVVEDVLEMLNSKTATSVPITTDATTSDERAKTATIVYPPSPGSDDSSNADKPVTLPPTFNAVPHTQSFTGMGKKQNRKPKIKSMDESESVNMVQKKRWTKRPEHWRTIAEYYKNNSLEATLIEFQDDLGDFSTVAQYHKLHSWKKELENDIDVRIQPPGREPAYGNEIDMKLLEAVLELLMSGHPVDDATLRNELVRLLAEEGRSDLLIENGGTCVFQTSWAARFWKRHESTVKEMRSKNIAAAQIALADAAKATKKSRLRVIYTPEIGEEIDDTKKPWTRRPENWVTMAEYFSQHGISNTLAAFKDDLGHLSYSAAYQKLNNWRNDMITQRELHSPGRPPNYGEMIDNQLLAIVHDRIKTNQPVDDVVMREILVDLLTAVGKETMLRENGGECTFGHSWAVRFRKRHNLPTKDQNGRKRKRVLGEDGLEEGEEDMANSAMAAVAATSVPMTLSAGAAAVSAIQEAVEDSGDSEDDEGERVEFVRKAPRL